ncbi:MAG: V-type ATPase subunit subunit G family protein [Candidatus Woesearchaeota archaeon]
MKKISEVKKLDKTLKEIKDAEKEAESIINSAKKKAENIILKAKESAAEIIENKKQEMNNLKENMISEKKKVVGTERAKIMRNTQQQIYEIDEKSKKNMNKAVDKVIKAFNECII